ncbi:farnesyl-diphosphate synthase [Enterococcus canis]|uniref:Farnesyl diphosphate synthase n=1 Tax=Enterococcus canis TaxID=214095 RepID=A0A1L8RKH9_9ENTE|nr:farnesyl diphosphate synthase [Enterococcus canis]OJG20273.1 farnesyl-diphosphate synthase [Enterococcus canis]
MTSFRQEQIPKIEKEMLSFLQEYSQSPRLTEAMSYSIEAGGKRLRPLLVLTTAASFQKELTVGMYQTAAALEMIHTYSLIHDDLPAMDDDQLRRGKPTNHVVFGEATATLAGDGLLTAAFQQLSLAILPAEQKILLIQQLSQAAGIGGMVAGQMGDILGEEQQLDLEALMAVHEGKTGALLRFALLAGGILAEQPEEVVQQLANLGAIIGLAFQIRDDLLDVLASSAELGKNTGRDAELTKSTYPSLLGITGAKEALQEQLAKARQLVLTLEEAPSFQGELLREVLQELELKEY